MSPFAHMDRAAAVFIGRTIRAKRRADKLGIDFADLACGIRVLRLSKIESGTVDMTLSEFTGLCEAHGFHAPDLLQQALRVRERKREKGEVAS